jgi:hypothetical protein
MNEEWIQKNLERFKEMGFCVANSEFEPTKEFYAELFKAGKHDSFVRKISSHIGEQIVPEIEVVGDYQIPILDLQAGLRFFDKVIDTAGDYAISDITKPKIRIGASYLRRVYKLGHILAHEMAHHYRRSRAIATSDSAEEEMLTDLTAVYIGFGKLMLNGAVDDSIDSTQEPVYLSEKDGTPYLGYPLLAYTYYLCAVRRASSSKDIYSCLLGPCVNMVRAFEFRDKMQDRPRWIRWVLRCYYYGQALPKTDGTEIVRSAWKLDESRHYIIKCAFCEAKLRIPRVNEKLEVTCPKCKNKFIVGLRYK